MFHKVFIAVSDPLGRKYRSRGISGSVLGVCKGKKGVPRHSLRLLHTPADLVNSFSVLSNKTYNPSFLHVLKLKPLQ